MYVAERGSMLEKLNSTETFLVAIMVTGAVVDIVQFSWIVKKAIGKVLDTYRNKVKKDILKEIKEGNLEPKHNKELVPFIMESEDK